MEKEQITMGTLTDGSGSVAYDERISAVVTSGQALVGSENELDDPTQVAFGIIALVWIAMLFVCLVL